MQIPLLTPAIYQALLFFYKLFGGNLGYSVIALTVAVKAILLPLMIPTIKSAKKMQDLKPHLDKLKLKHTDKKALQQAQLDLYKEHGVNPAAGCLPQLLQVAVLIALYGVFIKDFFGKPEIAGIIVNPNFLYLNLNKPDPYFIFPVLAGLSQFIFSLMMQSGMESHIEAPKKKEDKQKEEDNLEMAQAMQQQMLYMMPIMTVVISLKFQSGLVLYWIISTVFSIIQQYYFSGLGGLKPMLSKLRILQNNK